MFRSISGPAIYLTISALSLASLAGCGSKKEAATEQEASPAQAHVEEPSKDVPSAEADEARSVYDEANYTLKASAESSYPAGEDGTFGIDLKPKGKFHVSQDYPVRIELSGPERINFPKPELKREDAAAFTESSAHFDVPFKIAAQGEQVILAKVEFAVCTPENCMPDERTLAVKIAAR